MTKMKRNATTAATHERLSEVGKTVAKDVKDVAVHEAGATGKAFIEQLLGIQLNGKTEAKKADTVHKSERAPRSGDIFDIITFTKNTEYKGAEKKVHVEAHMNYTSEIARSSERANRVEMSELDRNIRQIQQELKELVHSSRILNNEFKTLTVEEAPPTIGDYHMKFFEWMLIVIRQAKAKVEDSGAWLSAVKGKGAKKGFWGMAKQHGTSFTLSGERTTATQTG